MKRILKWFAWFFGLYWEVTFPVTFEWLESCRPGKWVPRDYTVTDIVPLFGLTAHKTKYGYPQLKYKKLLCRFIKWCQILCKRFHDRRITPSWAYLRVRTLWPVLLLLVTLTSCVEKMWHYSVRPHFFIIVEKEQDLYQQRNGVAFFKIRVDGTNKNGEENYNSFDTWVVLPEDFSPGDTIVFHKKTRR